MMIGLAFNRLRIIFLAFLLVSVLGFESVLSAAHIDDEAVIEIDTFIKKLADEDLFSGSVLVAHDGEVLLSEGYGMANREWDVPNTPETKFRIGSITKQFTSMSILLLQEQGKLTIQDPICSYIEDCPDAWSAITIEQLMTHTSGVTGGQPTGPGAFLLPQSVDKLVDAMRVEPLDFEPGQGWSYSNSGYILLGYIIKEVSGQSYQRFLKEHIFDPLGLANTGYDDNRRVIKNRATGYSSDTQIAAYIDMTIPYSAGALYSTVGDLYIWITALTDEKVVSQDLLDAMWAASVPIPDSSGVTYGYGLASYTAADHTAIGHDGSIPGFVSTLNNFPDDDVTIIVLSNLESSAITQIVDSSARILFEEN